VHAVANGTPAAAGTYRFAVKLTMTDIPLPDGSHVNSACSAALVAPQLIWTAGHCFHDVGRKPASGPVPYPTTATIGRTDLSDTKGHVVNVVRVWQAPNADAALALLERPVYDVKPVRLATTPPQTGEVLRLAGWGATDPDKPVPATHLNTGQVEVSSMTDTTVGVRGFLPEADTSACLFDSGAPYVRELPFQEPILVSSESDGPTCPHDQEETTVRVDALRTWAKEIIHAVNKHGTSRVSR
jgi:hypothetical protein